MKKLIGTVIGAALLTAAPLCVHQGPKKAGLYVARADARELPRRRANYGYYVVGAPYPRAFTPTPYYGLAPYGGIAPYGIMPYPYSIGPPTGGFFMGSK
jgi:hypothetical protein